MKDSGKNRKIASLDQILDDVSELQTGGAQLPDGLMVGLVRVYAAMKGFRGDVRKDVGKATDED